MSRFSALLRVVQGAHINISLPSDRAAMLLRVFEAAERAVAEGGEPARERLRSALTEFDEAMSDMKPTGQAGWRGLSS